MSRRRQHQSVHQKTLRMLQEARIKSVPETHEIKREEAVLGRTPKQEVDVSVEPIKQKPVEITLNWKDETKSPLVPNLIPEGKMESLRREFINSVASGNTSHSLDQRALRDPEQFYKDALEGIRRWHTYSKER